MVLQQDRLLKNGHGVDDGCGPTRETSIQKSMKATVKSKGSTYVKAAATQAVMYFMSTRWL